MKKTYTQILFSLTSLLLIVSCDKTDCNKKDIYYNVNDKGRSMIPYSGFDTITYIRTNVGDTHTFIGTGKKTTYEVQSEAADCGNTLHYEKYYYTYKSTDYNDMIIGQYTVLNSSYEGYTYIDFNNQIFDGYINFNSVKTDLDSLYVIGKLYTKIEVISDSRNYKAYFSKNYGCIKMAFPNGATWELLSFKK